MTLPSDANEGVPDPAPDVVRPGHAWHLMLGLTLWFVWFCVTYGGLAVACAVAPPPVALGPHNGLSGAVLLLAAAAAAGFIYGAWACARAARRMPTGQAGARQRFIARSASALYATAAVSTAVVALPVLLLAPCV